MTCCLAIRCSDGLVAAADLEATYGNVRAFQSPKIIRARRGTVLMAAGSGGATDRVFDAWKSKGTLSGLVQILRAESAASKTKDDDEDEAEQVEYLHVGREGLRVVDGYGWVLTSRYPFAAIGIGCEVALGFLGGRFVSGIDVVQGARLARQCLRFVAANVSGVGAPFEVVVVRAKQRPPRVSPGRHG